MVDIGPKTVGVQEKVPGVEPFDLATLSYPDLVILLMQTGMPWGFTDLGDIQEADLYAFLIKTIGFGSPTSYTTSSPALQNIYSESYEKHLFAVRKMLVENKNKFEKPVLPIATLKNHVVVIDQDMNMYKVSFDDEYSNLDIAKIGPLHFNSVNESLDRIVNGILQEDKINYDDVRSLFKLDKNTLQEQQVMEFIKNVNKGYFKKFYNENKDYIRKSLRGELSECYFNKISDSKKGLNKIKDDFIKISEELEKIISGLYNYYGETMLDQEVLYANTRGVAEALKSDIDLAISVINTVLQSDNVRNREKIYDILSELYEEYMVGYKFINHLILEEKVKDKG